MTHPDKELSEFQEPLRLYKKVIPEALQIPDDIFFSRSNETYQKYREAWYASLFGRGFFSLVNPCKLRICINEEFPDFQMRVGGHVYDFEHTEVNFRGRKRGLEYIEREKDPFRGFPVKPANIEEAAEWICGAVKVKTDKRYSTPPHLLVCVNFEVRTRVDLKRVRELCAPHRSEFKSIWLLWKVSIAQVFASNEFGTVCEGWSEIPGYRKECEKRMGLCK